MIHKEMTLLLALLMAGCASISPEPSTKIEATEQRLAKEIAVGWIAGEWRTCIEDETCPKPTPKTVVLVEAPIMTLPQMPPMVEQVERKPEQIVVHFYFAKATPTKAGFEALKEALKLIKEDNVIRIEGYTDNIGSVAYNDRLAMRRAKFVSAWLKRNGIKNPIEIKAKGKCCYIASNDTEEGRAANRRAVVVLKVTGGSP